MKLDKSITSFLLVFQFAFSWWHMKWNIFYRLICHLYSIFSLVRYLLWSLASVLIYKFFVYCGLKALLGLSFANSPPPPTPVCGLSSYSPDIVFHRAAVFYFNEVQFINYFFLGFYLHDVSKKSLPYSYYLCFSYVVSWSFIVLHFTLISIGTILS
jgi:hypothetical protein